MASEIDVVEDLLRAEAIIHFWQCESPVSVSTYLVHHHVSYPQ